MNNYLSDDFFEKLCLKPRYYVKLTKANYKILNQYLHKHWKDYIGYVDSWEVTYIKNGYFFSESTNMCGTYVHTLENYTGSPTSKILTTHEFLCLLDTDLLNKFKAVDKPVNKSEDEVIPVTNQSFPIQPDFSKSDLIIMKHLLDLNIKFDSNDFNFYRGLFQLGYDFATITRVY